MLGWKFAVPSPIPRLVMPTPPRKLRKQYANEKYPEIVLRFEDGHEIKIPDRKSVV